MLFRYCFLLLIITLVFAGINSPVYSRNIPLRHDNSSLKLKEFNTKELKKYAADEDFNYTGEAPSLEPSLWDRFWRWFWDNFNVFSDAQNGGNSRYIFITLGCAAVIFAIVKFSGMDLRLVFMGKAREVEIPYTETLENIHEISFTDEIAKATAQKDFRLAVRLLYLQSLKNLNDAGRIAWEPDKTNSQYVRELKHPEQKHLFGQLTHQFEYIWYGNFAIDGRAYSQIADSFKQFNPVMR